MNRPRRSRQATHLLAGQAVVLEDRTLLAVPVSTPVRDIDHWTDGQYSGGPTNLVQVGQHLFYLTWMNDGNNSWSELIVSDGTPGGTNVLRQFDSVGQLTPFGDALFFVAKTEAEGVELWKSDGTLEGTVIVRDIVPGPGGSGVGGLTAHNGILYFGANDKVSGYEIWRSDGTQAGTQLAIDVVPGSESSFASRLKSAGGTLYFVASDAAHGRELWTTDGTVSVTRLLKDINPGPADGGLEYSSFTQDGGRLYFYANDGVHGTELWITDGTEPGTSLVADVAPGAASSDNGYGYSVLHDDGFFYFVADDSVHGEELWRTDGTAAGTSLVIDLYAGPSDSYISPLASYNGRIIFEAYTGIPGRQLWSTDGTAAETFVLAKIANRYRTDLYDFNVDDYVEHHGALFIIGASGIWKTDGTASGTSLVTPVRGWQWRALGDDLYFIGDNGLSPDLWKSDGTASGTVRVGHVVPGAADSSPRYFSSHNGVLYFSAKELEHGAELWRSDGTLHGTYLVRDLNPGTGYSDPYAGQIVNGVYYFRTKYGTQLWKSDGTTAGTVVADEFGLGPNRTGRMLGAVGSTLILSITDSVYGEELWTSDGTPQGTVLLKEMRAGVNEAYLRDVTFAGDRFYFLARNDGPLRESIWVSDGTAAGTVELVSFSTSVQAPRNLTEADGRLFFLATDATHGEELWTSDGTAAGTHLVKDIFPGTAKAQINQMEVMSGRLFFAATDDVHGRELWVSDGTSAGTHPVRDITPGAVTASIGGLRELDGRFYFTVSSGAGSSLWATDGTDAGTVQVSDLPGVNWSSAQNASEFRGQLYFEAVTTSPYPDRVIVVTDGTTAGTKIVQVIPPQSGSYPQGQVILVGSRLFFAGYTRSAGVELHALDLNNAPTSLNLTGPVFPESTSPGVLAGVLQTVDADAGETFHYSLVAGRGDNDNALFVIVADELRTAAALDYENRSSYSVRIRSADEYGLWKEQTLQLNLSDVNEFPVTIVGDSDPAANAVPENSPAGTTVGVTVFAFDADGSNNTVTYSLTDAAGGRFTIDPVTGLVTVDNGALLDRESAASHTITVLATSSDGSTSSQSFTINLIDVNEFKLTGITDANTAALNLVPENAPTGTPVGITARATDADATNNSVTYSMLNDAGGRFAIDPVTGVITVANGALLDREQAHQWAISVLAVSADGSKNSKAFAIALADVNEFKLTGITDANTAALNLVPENAANGTPVGITARAVDADATNSAVTYSLLDTAGGRFAIHPTTGVITVANGALLDREQARFWNISVLAVSADGSKNSKAFSIALDDVNEFKLSGITDANTAAPNLVTENAANGTLVGITAFASDGDATNNSVTYSLLNSAGGRFAINPTTGVITVLNGALLDYEQAKSWAITVLAVSSDGSKNSKAFAITLGDVAGA